MEDLFRKTLLAGLGFMDMTKEKVEDFVDDMIKRGEVQQADKAQYVQDAMTKVDQRAQEAKTWVSQQVEETWEKIKPKAQQQIDELQNKLASLTKELDEMKEKLNSKQS
jgi:polyhydroxyalkanoate synthesis regulator phasin